MAVFDPEPNIIKSMKPKPTPGEYKMLQYLSKVLPDDCKVYFQAKMDYSLPDIVIMRPDYGVVIIEVKDWSLKDYRAISVDCWQVNTGIGWVDIRSPIKQVQYYRNIFFDIYSRELKKELTFNSKVFSVVKPVVYFSGSSKEDVNNILNKKHLIDKYTEIIIDSDLSNGYFLEYLKNNYNILGKAKSFFFNQEMYDSLDRVFSQSKHSKLKASLKDIKFTKEQKKYIESKRNTVSKIRGVAGSGKTTVMAKRAVDAFIKTNGSPVLILTFNITLCHYIQDCISVFRNENIRRGNFVVKHYHLFINEYKNKNGIYEQFKKNDERYKYKIDKKNIKYKFKTIYVDEVQDYEKDWIDTIYNLLEHEGELVFWGDEEQNIYERKMITNSKNKKRVYTGVPGAWGILNKSYRCNGKIAKLAQLFQRKYLNQYDDKVMEYQENMFDDTSIKYVFEPNTENTIEKRIVNIFISLVKQKKLHYDDVCILSDRVALLRLVDQELGNRGYKTETTFETQEEYLFLKKQYNGEELQSKLDDIRRVAKHCFWMESGKIKLSTVHSYKGWGIDTEILIIMPELENKNVLKDAFGIPLQGENVKKINNELVNTALTRAKRNLYIINFGNETYHNFFISKDAKLLIDKI